MKLYLIRHGETEWNKCRRVQGSVDIPLNDYGRKLAYITAQKLKDIPFDCGYTSPLLRAKETGEIILEKHKVPLIIDERLTEADFGPFEGQYQADLFKQNHPFLKYFEKPEETPRIEGLEPPEHVLERAASFLEEVVKSQQKKYHHMAVFAHGALIHGLLTIIYQRELKDFWRDPIQRNCAVSTIEVQGDTYHVLKEAEIYYGDIDDE